MERASEPPITQPSNCPRCGHDLDLPPPLGMVALSCARDGTYEVAAEMGSRDKTSRFAAGVALAKLPVRFADDGSKVYSVPISGRSKSIVKNIYQPAKSTQSEDQPH